MQFLLSFLVLELIVVFHELGHFTAAKLCGIGVREFSLGMGPVLAWRRAGDTVYSLRAVPLGGFCAMHGEPVPEASEDGGVSGRGPDFKTDWGPGRGYQDVPRRKQALVCLMGPAFNILLGFVAAVVLAGLPGMRLGRAEVSELGPVSVARDAGVEIGDVILSVDGREVLMSQEYGTYLSTHPKRALAGYDLTVWRPSDGQEHVFHLVPDPDTGLVGITYAGAALDGPLSVLDGGARLVHNSLMMSIGSVGMLLRGEAGISDMAGIVGLASAMGSTVEEAQAVQEAGEDEGSRTAVLQAVLAMVLLVSVSLGVMNLLPLPALDGGRALIAVFEGITGVRIPRRVAEYATGLCMMALVCLMTVILVGDVVRLVRSML